MQARARWSRVVVIAGCLTLQVRPAPPPTPWAAPGSIPGPRPDPGAGRPVRQSKVPVSIQLDVPASSSGQVKERAALLDVVVKELTREEGVAEPPFVAVQARLEITLRGLADGYLLKHLGIRASLAGKINRIRDVFPGRARPGLAAERATVGKGRMLVGPRPASLVDGVAATGFILGWIDDDGRGTWQLQPPDGETITPGQSVALTLLMDVHQERQSAKLHVTVDGLACTAVLGQCTYDVDLSGTRPVTLRLRETPSKSKAAAK